jgi:hypothetical protein
VNVWLTALALFQPVPPEPVPVSRLEARRFFFPAKVQEDAAETYLEYLNARANWRPWLSEDYRDLIWDAQHRQRAWQDLYNARELGDEGARLRALEYLRDEIGEDNYRLGKMPDPVPPEFVPEVWGGGVENPPPVPDEP